MIKEIFKFAGPSKTVILISRDTDVLKNFDRIYVFSDGFIVENGSWKELIKKRGRFYREIKGKN